MSRPERGVLEAFSTEDGLQSSLSLVVGSIDKEWRDDVFEKSKVTMTDLNPDGAKFEGAYFGNTFGKMNKGSFVRNGRIVRFEQAVIPGTDRVAIVTILVPGPRPTPMLRLLRASIASLQISAN